MKKLNKRQIKILVGGFSIYSMIGFVLHLFINAPAPLPSPNYGPMPEIDPMSITEVGRTDGNKTANPASLFTSRNRHRFDKLGISTPSMDELKAVDLEKIVDENRTNEEVKQLLVNTYQPNCDLSQLSVVNRIRVALGIIAEPCAAKTAFTISFIALTDADLMLYYHGHRIYEWRDADWDERLDLTIVYLRSAKLQNSVTQDLFQEAANECKNHVQCIFATYYAGPRAGKKAKSFLNSAIQTASKFYSGKSIVRNSIDRFAQYGEKCVGKSHVENRADLFKVMKCAMRKPEKSRK